MQYSNRKNNFRSGCLFYYDVPVNFEKENFGNTLLKTIGLPPKQKDLADWMALANKIKKNK